MTTLVLGAESFSDIPDVNGQLVMLNGGSTGTITTGTFASRPAAGTAGNLYVDSTNFVWYYDNGTVWTILGDGPNPILLGNGSVTIPIGTTAQRPASPTTGMLRYNSTIGSYELYDSTWESLIGVIDKSTTSQAVTTVLTTTSLISFSVPANTLGTNGIIRVKLGGIWTTTAAGRNITFAIGYGTAGNLWSGTSGNLGANITVGWEIEFVLVANNSASAQSMSGRVSISPGVNNTGTGTGIITNVTTAPFASSIIGNTIAVTSTSAQTLTVSVNQSATGTFTKYYHSIEVL